MEWRRFAAGSLWPLCEQYIVNEWSYAACGLPTSQYMPMVVNVTWQCARDDQQRG